MLFRYKVQKRQHRKICPNFSPYPRRQGGKRAWGGEEESLRNKKTGEESGKVARTPRGADYKLVFETSIVAKDSINLPRRISSPITFFFNNSEFARRLVTRRIVIINENINLGSRRKCERGV